MHPLARSRLSTHQGSAVSWRHLRNNVFRPSACGLQFRPFRSTLSVHRIAFCPRQNPQEMNCVDVFSVFSRESRRGDPSFVPGGRPHGIILQKQDPSRRGQYNMHSHVGASAGALTWVSSPFLGFLFGVCGMYFASPSWSSSTRCIFSLRVPSGFPQKVDFCR